MAVAGALFPSFALILLGLWLRRVGFPAAAFWTEAERLSYWLLFPSLLFTTLASARLGGDSLLGMAASLIAAVLLVALLVLLSRPLWSLSSAAFTSVFQGAVRKNTAVGLAAAYALAGGEGIALAAVAMISMIPLLNLLCVSVLLHFRDGGGGGSALGREILKNPLILACVAGIGVNLLGIPPAAWLLDALGQLGRASVPLGLLVVGAALRWDAERRELKGILLSAVPKLLLMPLLVWGLCALLEVPADATRIAVLFGALPTAVSSFILARQLGGDEHLMASIITVQTLFAMVTLPLTLALLTGP